MKFKMQIPGKVHLKVNHDLDFSNLSWAQFCFFLTSSVAYSKAGVFLSLFMEKFSVFILLDNICHSWVWGLYGFFNLECSHWLIYLVNIYLSF